MSIKINRSDPNGCLENIIGTLIGALIGGVFTMAACGTHGTVDEGPGWSIALFGVFIGACLGALYSSMD